MMNMLRSVTILAMLLLGTAAHADSFLQYIADYRTRAMRTGVPVRAIDRALDGVTLNPDLIEQDRAQPETRQTLAQYVSKTVTPRRVDTGRNMAAEYRSLLARVSRDTNVPPHIMLALWGKETDFGGFTGNAETVSALATMAYEGRRRAFFEQELLAAIVMLDRLGWSPRQMRGSWAGAVGQCQFMPSNYAKYGIDGDGDARVDLWNSMPDVFYSMANLLNANGWNAGQSWGQKVSLPAGFSADLIGREKPGRPASFWTARGVRFSRGVDSAVRIYQPDGPGSQAYAVGPNFDVLMRWNRSGYFATAVGVLSDMLATP